MLSMCVLFRFLEHRRPLQKPLGNLTPRGSMEPQRNREHPKKVQLQSVCKTCSPLSKRDNCFNTPWASEGSWDSATFFESSAWQPMIPFRTNCFAKNTQWTSTPQCTDLHSCWFTTFTQTWVVPASRFSPPLKPQWTGKTTKGWAPNSPEKCLQELQPHSKAWQLLQLSLGLKRFMGLGNLLRIFNLAPNWNSDQTVLERIGTEPPHHNAQSRGLWIITAADLQLSLNIGSFLRLGFSQPL